MTITLKLQDNKILEGPYIIYKQNVSEKEFWEFANEDIKCELIDGVLVIHSPATPEHEDIFAYLLTILRIYLDKTKTGKVFGSRLVMRLNESWNPEPDLIVIKPEKYPHLSTGRLDGPANLVMEILSESTRSNDIEKKIPQYLKLGVEEVWIIDPLRKQIQVKTATKEIHYYDSKSDEIIESVVISNLQLHVRWIWDRETYPTSDVIIEIMKENK